MNKSPQEILYGRVNLLNSLMVAGWLILALVMAIVAILFYGRMRQVDRRIDELNKTVAALTAPAGHERVASARSSRAYPPAAASQPDRGAANGQAPAAGGAPDGRQPTPPAEDQSPAAGARPANSSGPYDVSPTAGQPTVDPNRPAGLAGWFFDLKSSAQPDTDNPMLYLITGPRTVQAAMAELSKITPEDAAKAKIPADDRVLAAQLFLQGNEDEQAHRWALAATRDTPAHGRAWLVAGLASLALKDFPRAISELTQAVDKLPDRPEPLKALAESYIGANQLDQAIAAYRKAVAISAKELDAGSRLAELLMRSNQIDAAIGQLQANLAEDPKRSADRARLAKLLVTRNKAKEALAALDATPPGAPEDVRLNIARGQALLTAGDLPAAEAALEKAVDATPLSAEGWYFLGLSRLKQRKNMAAVAALERSIAIDSTLSPAWEYLGVALANEGRIDEAAAKLQEAVRLNVSSPQTHYILALLYVRQKQFDSALASLKQAIQLDATYLDKARNETLFNTAPADSGLAKFIKAGK